MKMLGCTIPGKELGRVNLVLHIFENEIATGQQYACKSISKKKLVTKADKDDMRREIKIMQHLSGQPNIAELNMVMRIKITDFGLSVFIQEGKLYKDIAGVLNMLSLRSYLRSYGKEIDIWSAGNIDFESEPWPSVSSSAKDLVQKMLTKDPKKRITAAQSILAEGRWCCIDKPLEGAVLSRMKQFRAMNKLKKLMKADVDGNGSIDYTEFITATMHKHRLERDENLYTAFQYFDKDGSGEIISEVDTDNDGRINYEEFAIMMRRSQTARQPSRGQVAESYSENVHDMSSFVASLESLWHA
ncbi:Calcium-dependent protein kinase [Datura stramonium]|uniref:Calcium-dependent protein kinase n=1 Tax=Datura stramonium TaxID=4076 RepID=A0ABS8THG5_DATST|nr:Calcium-dependent protein kinase [Datura stramonium]